MVATIAYFNGLLGRTPLGEWSARRGECHRVWTRVLGRCGRARGREGAVGMPLPFRIGGGGDCCEFPLWLSVAWPEKDPHCGQARRGGERVGEVFDGY